MSNTDNLSGNTSDRVNLNDESHSVDDELLASAIDISQLDLDEDESESVDLEEVEVPVPRKYETTAEGLSARVKHNAGERKAHDDHWDRTPNVTGKGAIHCRTFFAKLRPDSIEHMDEEINQWLDLHPEYEVKMVNSSVGQLVGKMKEDALFVTVWV